MCYACTRKGGNMASSRMRLRRTLREHNDLAHNEEKRVEQAQTQSASAALALAALVNEWDASGKTADDAERLGPQMKELRGEVVAAKAQAEASKGRLDHLASRYADIYAALATAVSAEPGDAELVVMVAEQASIKTEHDTIRAAAAQLIIDLSK